MQFKSERDFAKHLREGEPRGLYLLYGSEGYLIQTYVKMLTERFGGGFSAFNIQKLDGRRPDLDLLEDAVETLPLMAGSKLVVLEDLDLKALSAEEADRFSHILRDLPDSCVLVVTGRLPVFDPKSAAGRKLIKLCGEAGHAVELGARTQGDLVSWLRSGAQKAGCTLSADVARYILQTCETEMAALSGELHKLCAYARGGDITREMVDFVTIPRTEARVFDLSKAIQAGNAQWAMEILGNLFYLREQPLAILAVLTMSYADLYRVRAARSEGKTPAAVIEAFGYKGREFRVNNAWNSRMSAGALRASLEALLTCDRRIKSSGADAKILLEQTVVRLLQLREAS